ncbi:unnamed protein product [Brassica rapa subsp. narinosa]
MRDLRRNPSCLPSLCGVNPNTSLTFQKVNELYLKKKLWRTCKCDGLDN